jgi:endonuclease/exonuclease/phosphatase family metal-dependent hydrolase
VEDSVTQQSSIGILTINVNGYEPYEDRNPILRKGITELRPDLLSFQEAAYPQGKRHQIAECLDGLGYYIDHQFDGLEPSPGGTGTCIASRWPMERAELMQLPSTPRAGDYPVAALCETIHVPPPFGDILFVNPKTDWQLHVEKEREEQVIEIAELVAKHGDPEGFPAIVAADFDASPDNASIRFMTGKQSLEGRSTHFLDAWDTAGDGSAGYTWTSDNPFNRSIIDRYMGAETHRRRIDYIFIGSPFLFAKSVRVTSCKVVLDEPVDGIYASGHFGVYAVITR